MSEGRKSSDSRRTREERVKRMCSVARRMSGGRDRAERRTSMRGRRRSGVIASRTMFDSGESCEDESGTSEEDIIMSTWKESAASRGYGRNF